MKKKNNARKLTDFGKKVKKKLIEVDMTQVELAEKLGTSKVYLNLILYGERTGEKYLNNIVNILEIEERNIRQVI